MNNDIADSAKQTISSGFRRTIRVFISSTFRDMHAERDYLSRQVFPELRSRCQKRGAEFIGLDLRWGVTEEEAQREGALKICLDEIERCRPFFVCLLGSRYGWVPPPEEVGQEWFEDAVRGAPPIAITDWYTLDETSVPPVYRLRRNRPITQDVAETLARFWEDVGLPNAGESITAREILRGVFEEGFPATRALFYLRKPGIETALAFPRAFVPVFVEQDAKRRAKLENLETKIRECADRMVVRDYDARFAGLQIDPSLMPAALSDAERERLEAGVVTGEELNRFSAPVREVILRRGTVALGGLETLGNLILEDLWAAIEKELERPVEVLDDHQRERAYHERFVVDRTRLFLGRDEIVERILNGLADPGGGNLMAVTGAPGSGKSALLAECARRARERFQGALLSPSYGLLHRLLPRALRTRQRREDALVIPHFIGVSPGSTILTNALRSICETLKRECSSTDEIPADRQKLLQKWPKLLEKAGAQRRVILLLDALNQLDPLDHSHELGWIPYRMPRGVTLVVSALPGDCLDRLRHRVSGEAVIDVPILAARDRQALVKTRLGQRGKKLSAAQLECLLDTTKRPEAGLPLYLLVALEELSLFGSYDALDGRIDLLPATVAELFDQVLARLEHDHERDMTTSICRWIAVSRSGMLESEILDLLAGREQLFPRARWSRFYRALEPYLRPVEEQTGEGLLAFYHDQLRFAVYRRYLDMQSPDEQPTDAHREAHGELAQYFRKVVIEEDGEFPKWRWDQKRSLSELPHHQLSAGMWEALEKTLTDIGFVEAKSRTGMVYDLARDYAAAERAWPGQEGENREEWKRERRLNDYVDALTAYSRADTARRADPTVATPPLPSVARTSKPEVMDAARQWTPVERVRAWGHFVSNYTVALASGQEPAFQIAYNSADFGPVAAALEERLRQGAGPTRPWLRLTNRHPFHLHPACLKTLEGHTDEVFAVAVTPDGLRAVSASKDMTLRVWDLETGHSRALEACTGRVTDLAVTPDGRRAVFCCDGDLRVCDLETGHSRALRGGFRIQNVLALDVFDLVIGNFRALWGDCTAFDVTPDGRRAVFASDDHALRVWDLETGDSRVLKGHTGSVCFVVVTPDGRRAVSRSDDDALRVWDLETGHSRVLEGHMSLVGAVGVTPDGQRAVSWSDDHALRVWDLETGHSRVINGHTGSFGLAVTPNIGRSVGFHSSLGIPNNTLRVWDHETGDSRVLEGHTNWVNAVAMTPDGRRAVSASKDTTLRVWDLETGDSHVLKGHTDSVSAVAVTPDGRRAVSGSEDKALRVWDLDASHSRVLLEGHTQSVVTLAVTPDGRHAVSGSYDNTLRVWDLETGHSRVLEEHPGSVTDVEVTPDGRRAIGTIHEAPPVGPREDLEAWFKRISHLRVWDLETGRSRILKGHSRDVLAVAVTPDGRRTVSGGGDFDGIDCTLRVWDLETGHSRVLEGHTNKVNAIAVTPDGRCAVSASNDQTMRVWDLETGHSRALHGHTHAVWAVAATPDGRCAISGSGDGRLIPRGSGDFTLRVWDLETGQARVLEGHTKLVSHVAVTPDGRRAVSGSDDNTLRVWDLETGRSRVLQEHTGAVGVAVTSDGRRAISGSGDKILYVWDLETGENAIYASAPGGVNCFAERFPVLVAGTGTGRVDFLRLMGAHGPLPLLGPRITTVQRLWLCAPGVTGGRWDDAFTAVCGACGQRFPAPAAILDTIAALNRDSHIGPDDSPCLKLPTEAWDDPHLLSECPKCHKPLRFNPFVVDSKGR